MQGQDCIVKPVPIADEGIDNLENEQQGDQGRRQPPAPGRPKSLAGRRIGEVRAEALTKVVRDCRRWGMIQLVVPQTSLPVV